MTNRYKGVVNVYRDNQRSTHLSASLTLPDKSRIEWDKCPKCFNDLIVDGIKNKVEVEVSLTLKNGYLERPRKVVKLSEPY